MTSFSLPGFDLSAFVAATLAEDLGVGWPGGGRSIQKWRSNCSRRMATASPSAVS
jgi:hypothetical protein